MSHAMENFKSKTIKEIAETLDCGNDCYYNPKTGEIVAIPKLSDFMAEEEFEDLYEVDLEKLKKNEADFIKIEVLESFEAFKIMELFVEQMPDNPLKSELETILQRKKPFQNFKYAIDTSAYRASWFEFKQNELEKNVREQLESD